MHGERRLVFVVGVQVDVGRIDVLKILGLHAVVVYEHDSCQASAYFPHGNVASSVRRAVVGCPFAAVF